MDKGADDFSEEPVRSMDKTEKKTGDIKKKAIFTVAGAALGAFIGDTLIGREEFILDYSHTHYAATGIDTEMTTYAYGHDRGGIFEDIMGKDQFSDTYNFSSTYSIDLLPGNGVASITGGIDDVTISENTLRDFQHLGAFAPDSIQEIVPYGAYEGAALGGLSGFAAEWMSRKMKKRGKNEEY